jgi:DNA recombination protein RmuC
MLDEKIYLIVVIILLFIILFLIMRHLSSIAILNSRLIDTKDKNLQLEDGIKELNQKYTQEYSLRASLEAKLEYITHQDSLQEEFERIANRVLDSNREKFVSISSQNIDRVIEPLQRQLSEFNHQITDIYTKDSQDRAVLKYEIDTLKNLNQKIGQDAINLTNALKGESKSQGVWGEMILERVLEASGLREGYEFEREVTAYGDDNKRFRPDVIVRLPDNRDIVIDSKTSLVAYERYISSKEPSHLKAHLSSIKRHIDTLSEKNYERLRGVNTLDFIFMFTPIEGALSLALQSDTALYDYAYNKKIILVSPTTLLVAMRTVDNIWRQQKQHQNAKEIAKKAGVMYDKFVGFSDELIKLSKQFDTMQNSFQLAKNRLSEGRGNLIQQAQQLKELGAQSSKDISSER